MNETMSNHTVHRAGAPHRNFVEGRKFGASDLPPMPHPRFQSLASSFDQCAMRILFVVLVITLTPLLGAIAGPVVIRSLEGDDLSGTVDIEVIKKDIAMIVTKGDVLYEGPLPKLDLERLKESPQKRTVVPSGSLDYRGQRVTFRSDYEGVVILLHDKWEATLLHLRTEAADASDPRAQSDSRSPSPPPASPNVQSPNPLRTR